MKAILPIVLILLKSVASAQPSFAAYRSAADTVTCITKTKLLVFEPVDSLFQKVTKIAVKDLIASIKTCGYGYRYDSGFTDKACRLLLPKWLDDYSLSFGDDDFFISFDDHDTASGTCTILHYDLHKTYHGSLLQQPQKNSRLTSKAHFRRGKLYTARDRKGQFTGEIFLDDHISIAYFTREVQKVPQLRTCILSCRLY